MVGFQNFFYLRSPSKNSEPCTTKKIKAVCYVLINASAYPHVDVGREIKVGINGE
jgi:hypothetical protein